MFQILLHRRISWNQKEFLHLLAFSIALMYHIYLYHIYLYNSKTILYGMPVTVSIISIPRIGVEPVNSCQ